MNENTRLFVEALRSGYYKQAQEVLVKIGGTDANGEYYDEAMAYCCLGVGSKLAGCEYGPDRGFRFTRPNRGDEEVWYDTLPGQELFDWLGIDVKQNNNVGDEEPLALWSDEGRDIHLDAKFKVYMFGKPSEQGAEVTEGYLEITLANLNDWGCTFPQIADMIEHFGFKGALVPA